MVMKFAAEVAGLSELFDDIQRKHFEKQDALNHYNILPENQPNPYHPENNPVIPDYPGGRPTGTGLFSMLPGLVATQDTSGWPSINRPAPRHEPVYKYDKHMDMRVPNIPVKQAYIAPLSLPKDLENAFAKKHHGIMYDF